jgi:hypothetical protein
MIVMKRGLSLLLLTCVASAAMTSSAVARPSSRITSKATNEFVTCFAGAQQRAALPWSFVPRENGGGTFSNAGAVGVRVPYFLDVTDRGTRREIRLERGSTIQFRRAVMSAVDRCI